MYSIRTTAQFRRDVKRCQRQGKDMSLFKVLNETLIAGQTLPEKYRDHALMGNWRGHRDCHITPDWLLIYRIDADEQEIEYVRMGSHAELFNQ
jgi:mRNA interferase YafQ